MTISGSLKAKVEELKTMGKREVENYRGAVANSMLDNPTKFFFYDIIDSRLAEFDREVALAVSDDVSFDMPDGVER
ncbi:MAG: hypothetical protein OQL19_18360 [Gammaproteobacteria bacterium]|nr:hypothetical protein [Gammaproteobacteria bacterium]